ncbi:hypothetical protein ACFL2Y_04485 [Candidatus Omnitrophota bacterium]
MKREVLFMSVFLVISLLLGNLGIGNIYAVEEEKPDPVELDGTEWDIQLRYTDAQGEQKTIPDKLIFKDGKFNSENQEDKGYKFCNYTLSVKGDATVFETMQTKDKDKSFWRGDVRRENIRGVLSVHPDQGEVKDYRFNGALVSGDIEETRKEREARIATEKVAKQAELVAQKAAKAAQSIETNATDQGAGEKVKGLWQKITGQSEEQ